MALEFYALSPPSPGWRRLEPLTAHLHEYASPAGQHLRRKLVVALNFGSRMPSGLCCKPLAWLVQQKIVDELEEKFSALEDVGEVEFKYY